MGRTLRPSRLLAGLAAALIVVAGGAAAAHADDLAIDGDGLTPVSQKALSVSMCAGQPATAQVLIAAHRVGNGSVNIFANGSKVTVGVPSISPGISVGLSKTTIDVPSGWSSLSPNLPESQRVSTDTITATVQISPKQSSGSGSIGFSYAGVNAAGTAVSGPGSLSVGWTIVNCDTTPPTLALPANMTVEATSAAGAPVPFVTSATDVAPLSPAVSCTPSSGSVFGFGTTTVNCQSTDAAGNTAKGSFTVTVEDTIAPAIGQVSDIALEATGPVTTAAWTAPSAWDAVDGSLATTCTPPSGSAFSVGSTQIVCVVADAHGNTGSASFSVTIDDSIAPALLVPTEVIAEATSGAGAAVSYTASASDLVDGSVTPSCTPASGSTFPLGTTTVSCEAKDGAGNASAKSFPIHVRDTTAPELTVPASLSAEATGPLGAAVAFPATADDAVDADVDVVCSPASGSTFVIGETSVTCDATDDAGNRTSRGFVVTVQDTTGPSITVPAAPVMQEATGPEGAVVAYTATASDLVDGPVEVTCVPASGSTFALGTHAVVCDAQDSRGNKAEQAVFSVTVEDTTAPELSVAVDPIVAEATGPDGAVVADFGVGATDVVDGPVGVSCDRAPGSTFALGSTTVNCMATDKVGNLGRTSLDVTVQDTTAPGITWSGGPADGASYPFDHVPAAPSCAATDAVDPAATCAVTGYGTGLGSHTLTATAKDKSGNTATATRSFRVEAWKTGGFYAPVDGNGVWNTVKGGSTVPLKFELFAGSSELTSTSAISSFKTGVVSCASSGALADEIEVTTTGGTTLRYDATAGQFIQNWQTPKSPGTCYKVTMTAKDGTAVSALFKLK
ncbi:HYR domain-containing protein [Microbacterium sp. BK668]|uniref:HYR domain-containing protein n=1 Tax=Microbacterium sp. BK668 TaxID=2512118 RepID=UPI00105F9E29|nr:HYR domain-containing protein [Microbacterium sp. BK668]TDN88441.1 HYR domain-containing protein [Microbacterium sp. BK668]